MSYSQAKQDLFVLEQTKNKRNGLFLEIGANSATSEGNNTYLLESQYNWYGISIELESRYNYSWQTRTAKYFNMNALDFDYEDELTKLCGENLNTIDLHKLIVKHNNLCASFLFILNSLLNKLFSIY